MLATSIFLILEASGHHVCKCIIEKFKWYVVYIYVGCTICHYHGDKHGL